ncbi:MAG TPA: hypothetical protein VF591_04295 [Pyrinomonadaceae bacterium]|jgi:hypothetical protein
MPTIKNMSYGALSVARAEKDPLTLGPRETADISEVEFDSDEIQRHLRDRRIAIIPGAQSDRGGGTERGRGRSRTETGGGSGPSTPTE